MVSKENRGGVLHRRSVFIQAMRQKTFEAGYFTTADIADTIEVPRSTAQDWVNRLIQEGCIFLKEEKRGRNPARYASRSALPKTTCRRIFTTVDGEYVEIFHECLSSGCAGFCEFHHRNAGGAAISVSRDGMVLRELAHIGSSPALNLDSAAVGLVSVSVEGDEVVQTLRSVVGGPAFSLSSMMGQAKGVSGVSISVESGIVTGLVRTKALVPITIGIDDTDRKGCGGATFALAHALMKYLTESGDAIAIRHQVASLSQEIEEMTAGNSCSFLEIAVEPSTLDSIAAKVCRFVDDESVSENWGVAILRGIFVPETMLELASRIRSGRVTLTEVQAAADACGVLTFGGRGIIGACAAVSLKNQPQDVLLDSRISMQ